MAKGVPWGKIPALPWLHRMSRCCFAPGRMEMPSALDQLVPLVHRELHRIARHCMAAERSGHTPRAHGTHQRSLPTA